MRVSVQNGHECEFITVLYSLLRDLSQAPAALYELKLCSQQRNHQSKAIVLIGI
eukprot:IDg20610t1